jgi:hypothetical protein
MLLRIHTPQLQLNLSKELRTDSIATKPQRTGTTVLPLAALRRVRTHVIIHPVRVSEVARHRQLHGPP